MVTILHGTWLLAERRFFVWGEASEVAAPARRRRRPRVHAHPRQARADALRERLAQAVPTIGAPPEHGLTLWLPTVGNAPRPSRELQSTGVVPTDGPAHLAPWRVLGLLLTPAQALDALLALGDNRSVGADIRAWRVAALLAMELLAGQQVLPALARGENGRFVAGWRPHAAPATARSIAALAKALPPLCRAAVEEHTRAPNPRTLLDDFLAAAVDRLIRDMSAAERPPIPPHAAATPGGAWLAALLGNESLLPIKGRPAEDLFKAWQEWSSQAEVSGDAAFRITFRLEPPADERTPWGLSYLLQATDDPSLIVSAGQIWRERGRAFTYLDRRFEQPQERMLRGLGYAARLFPPIERSLSGRAPERAEFSTEEAFTFLKEAAPLLEQSGFGVIVPSWWGGTGRIKARAHVGRKPRAKEREKDSPGTLGLDSLVGFRWELSIGDQSLSRADFERLVALKQPLVQVRGEWIVLDPEQIQRALSLFERGGELRVAELLRMGLSGTADSLPEGVAFDGVQAEGALGALLAGLSGGSEQLSELPQPRDFAGTLRPYQLRGFSWLAFMRRWGMGACLADDMGLGKSPQAIALLLHDVAAAPEAGPSLIVCPTSVAGNWQRELARFGPSLRVLLHQGADRPRDAAFAAAAHAHDVVITSYPLLARDRELITAVPWRLAILDEAQNIKNSDTRQAQAARALSTGGRLALTGTPVENRLSELWSIMAFLNPGYLGGETDFRRRYARPIERAGDPSAAQQLRQITAPFLLRRLKTDPKIIADLPEKIEMKIYVPLTQEQATLYEATVRDALEQIGRADADGEQLRRRGLVLAMLTRLKQICNHPAHFLKDGSAMPGRSGKLDRLDEMLEEARAANDRALIFTQFAEMGGLLQQYLSERLDEEVLFLHGGTPARERDGMIRRFQAPDGPGVFLLSLKAGGVGLNLTSANHVFHFDRWWNPAVEDQATDRAFRIGQMRNVQVHKFVCTGTLEEKIDALIESKRALVAQVLSEGESWLTELSTDQLRDMVALRREDITE